MYIIIALLVLSVVILAHELGHYIFAKRVGIEVVEFSMGFGPKLISFGGPKNKDQKQDENFISDGPEPMVETEFALRLIPFGASVRMTGEAVGDKESSYSYINKTPWEKIQVAAAGPVMNLVLAVIIYVLTYSLLGIPMAVDKPQVGTIIDGKPAAHTQLKSGDRILAVNNKPVKNWTQIVNAVSKTPRNGTVIIRYEHDKNIKSVKIKTEWDAKEKASRIGITMPIEIQKVGFFKGIKLGFIDSYDKTVLMLKGIFMVFSGTVSSKDMAGPVGITKMISDYAQAGLMYLLSITALLSINLGLFNLLPFPALDGSKIVFCVIEAVRKRPIEPDTENMVHFVGFALLMLLLVFVTYNDIIKLVRG